MRTMTTLIAALAIWHVPAIAQTSETHPPAAVEGIEHLPSSIQDGILAWRVRLRDAVCLKVVNDMDQIWERMHELDEDGAPTVVRRERFQAHAWMTPDMLWMVVFAYDGDEANTSTPASQILWYRDTGIVRERYWDPEEQVYRVIRYEEPRPFGPANANVADCRGCLYGTVMSSWLAGGPRLADRSRTVHSVALMREPNLAIVPPHRSEAGVWFDVFSDTVERDRKPEADRLYRRNDFMLLSRNESGEPEVSEWRTIVLTDPDDGGATPTQIYAIRRLSYQFYDSIPTELLVSTSAFARDIDNVAVPLDRVTVSDEIPDD